MAVSKQADITIHPHKRGHVTIAVLGESPFIARRMSQKAKGELTLGGRGRKSIVVRSTVKHDPLAEFLEAPYTRPPGSPTYIAHLGSAFKAALATAALDSDGIKKTQIERLVYVEQDYVPIYGIPQVFMSIVRSADINRTPDVRTRAIIARWAAVFSVSYTLPLINGTALLNLMDAAGHTSGMGDWRVQHGGSYGRFSVVALDNPELLAVMQSGGYDDQRAAMRNPTCYDNETEELLSWFESETLLRGMNAMRRGEEVEV